MLAGLCGIHIPLQPCRIAAVEYKVETKQHVQKAAQSSCAGITAIHYKTRNMLSEEDICEPLDACWLQAVAVLSQHHCQQASHNTLHMQERERQQMADMIKKQYLGGEKLKKKMLKPSEKFKFNFDWEAGDDTSKDLNQLLFGRGLRAGVDRREQKKVGSTLFSRL